MHLPKRCPRCTGVRWNQRYLDEELTLIERLQDELYEKGLIRESGDKIEYEGQINYSNLGKAIAQTP
jgi:phage FluMu protein Com